MSGKEDAEGQANPTDPAGGAPGQADSADTGADAEVNASPSAPGRDASSGLIGRILSNFEHRWLEAAGFVLAIGAFVALLFLIIASFFPATREITIYLGYRSLLTMGGIGVIAIIAARNSEKMITTLTIVIIAVVFISVDDLVTLYVTVFDKEVPANLPGRRAHGFEVVGEKGDFSETARLITETAAERLLSDADRTGDIYERRQTGLQEEIRKIIEDSEIAAIAERLSDSGADELLFEIHQQEFVVSYLRYKDLPQFRSEIDFLRFEGLIDDRYGDMPDTVVSTDFGCIVLDTVRDEDLDCRRKEREAATSPEAPLGDVILVGEQRVVDVGRMPATLRLKLEETTSLEILAATAPGSNVDPYLEFYVETSDGSTLLQEDDDSGGGLHSRIASSFEDGDYVLVVRDLFGDPGQIIVTVDELATRGIVAERPSIELNEDSTPLVERVFVSGREGVELLVEVEGPKRQVRVEATSTWLDTTLQVYNIEDTQAPLRPESLLAANDDREPGIIDSCVVIEVEEGSYVVRVTDFDQLTGDASVIFTDIQSGSSGNPCGSRRSASVEGAPE